MLSGTMSDYDFTKITCAVAQQENVQDYKLEFKYSTNKGDGYTGIVRAVRIVGSNKTLELVYKYYHRNPEAHSRHALRLAYITEISLYKNIIPAFTKFQEEYHVKKPFNNTANYYGGIDEPLNELLVLDNVTCLNYEIYNRKEVMNVAHLELALKTLAKFHGTSFALKTLQPNTFEALTVNMDGPKLFKVFMDVTKFYYQMSEMIKDGVEFFDPIEERTYREILEQFAINVERDVETAINSYREFDVILQGDCWCNNIMFQYDDLNHRVEPKDVILIDYQMARTGSPVFDLTYFFYTSASTEIIANLEHFQKVYHNSLAEHLISFGLNMEDVYPFEKFQEQWKQMAKFGLMMCFNVRKMMLLDSKDAPDLTKDLHSYILKLSISEENEALYRRDMRDIVKHFIDLGFL